MNKIAPFLVLMLFSCFAQAAKPFMSCADGDYLLSTCVEGYVCVNDREPLTQKVNYLNKEKDGSAMIVTLPFSRDSMGQWEKRPERQRLYIYDYPDGVHPRLLEKANCKWLTKNRNKQ